MADILITASYRIGRRNQDMTIRIKRTFHGYASIRDYQAKQALRNNEDIVIVMGNKTMRIPNKDILTGTVSTQEFESIHEKGLKYHLIDYPWKTETLQESLI